MSTVTNFLRGSMAASAAVYAGCRAINSPQLESIKKFAAGVFLGAAAMYWFHKEEPVQAKPTPSPTNIQSTAITTTPPSSATHRAASFVKEGVIEARHNQFSPEINAPHACTMMALTAVSAMLRGKIDLDGVLKEGKKRYDQVIPELEQTGYQFESKTPFLSMDECLHHPEMIELDTPRFGTGRTRAAQQIPINISQGDTTASFLQALRQLEQQADQSQKPCGGILIMSGTTYGICIHPQNKDRTRHIQFFDSHGTQAFDTRARPSGQNAGAILATFNSSQELAEHLDIVRLSLNTQNTDAGLHPCWLNQ